MSGHWTDGELGRRVGRYEAIFEPLVKIFAVLGRWGSQSEFQIAKDVITSLADQEIIGGSTALIALRHYPAMLLTYAYGLGALRANQLARVSAFFRILVPGSNGNRAPLVSRLFLDTFDGADRDVWNRLPEFPEHNRKTPLSDHLHCLFQDWLGEEIFLPKEYTAAFEEFEFLGSLTFTTMDADEKALDEMLADQTAFKWMWVPVGRIRWDGAVRRQVLTKWDAPENRKALLEAKFASSSAHFEKAITHLDRLIARSR